MGGVFSGVSEPLPTPTGAPGYVRAEIALTNVQVNGCEGMEIKCTNTPSYTGSRLAFGSDMYYSRLGYKAPFQVVNSSSTRIQWEDFTRAWDDATGLPVVKCTEETGVCPTFVQMNNLQRLEISAEGVLGEFHLEIESIGAYGCTVDAMNG